MKIYILPFESIFKAMDKDLRHKGRERCTAFRQQTFLKAVLDDLLGCNDNPVSSFGSCIPAVEVLIDLGIDPEVAVEANGKFTLATISMFEKLLPELRLGGESNTKYAIINDVDVVLVIDAELPETVRRIARFCEEECSGLLDDEIEETPLEEIIENIVTNIASTASDRILEKVDAVLNKVQKHDPS